MCLELDDNGLGDEGGALLADALTKNFSLAALSLRGNGLECEGAMRLAVALGASQSLTALELGRNRVGRSG